MTCLQRIEIDGHRPIRRHDIANAGDGLRLKLFSHRHGPRVDRRIDPVLELDDERGVARGYDTERAHAR